MLQGCRAQPSHWRPELCCSLHLHNASYGSDLAQGSVVATWANEALNAIFFFRSEMFVQVTSFNWQTLQFQIKQSGESVEKDKRSFERFDNPIDEFAL